MFEQLTLFKNFVPTPKKKSYQKVKAGEGREREKLSFYNFPVQVDRVPRKSLSAQIKPSGIIKISCAKKYSHDEILGFLEMHKNWVFASQTSYQLIRNKYPEKIYEIGELYSFLGKEYPLNIRLWDKKKLDFGFAGSTLTLEAPKEFLGEKGLLPEYRSLARQAIRKFYKNAAEIYIPKRVDAIAESMCLKPNKLSLRSQKTLWGSCSSEGNISINWKLMSVPAQALDYVVVHEVAHLDQPNHSKLFWSLVETHCPNYKTWRNWLRENQYATDFLSKTSELYHS